ncbi:MAG TPA: ACT domain-containing protein [Vicinamibacteria bacterium]|nr:ACT domain-containing protein [Vicinamibacteria bacterium]
MAVSIRKITLWRTEVPHRPGGLAEILEPLAAAGADLQTVMGYRIPGQKGRAVVEVAPLATRKAARAAEAAGLVPAGAPTLLVLGDNRPGLANRIARALAASGVNIAFLVAQVVGRRYSAVFGFESEADLDKAVDRIRAAVTLRPRR